jgi:pimeloyl-ACP methyl ester carboxylesterase
MDGFNSTARLGDVEIEYRRIDGDIHAPALVFLHEGLGSVGAWRDFPEALCNATGYPGLVYSRYGNGFSTVLREPRPVTYMHDEALQTLPALLDALAIRSTILVGHSDGASIAIVFAAEHPERVAGAIVEAPHVFVEPESVRSIAGIRTDYKDGTLRSRLGRYHADPDATFYGWNDVWLSPEFAGWNIETSVDRLTVPLLVVQGYDDQYGTLAQVESILRRHRDTDALLLAGCGHAPHRERAPLVVGAAGNWIIERFIGSTETTARGDWEANAVRPRRNRTEP